MREVTRSYTLQLGQLLQDVRSESKAFLFTQLNQDASAHLVSNTVLLRHHDFTTRTSMTVNV